MPPVWYAGAPFRAVIMFAGKSACVPPAAYRGDSGLPAFLSASVSSKSGNAMATQLSKAHRIRKILHLSNAEIAKRVGCRVEYVRSVRQRTDENGHSFWDAANRNWREANREHFNAVKREWYRKRRAEVRAS
jgi:hypothetical protein